MVLTTAESNTSKSLIPARRRLLVRGIILLAVLGLLSVLGVLGYYFGVVAPNVPAIDAVTDYRPKIPLRVYTADNVLIGEFGEEHRDFVAISKIPDLMKKAVLAIEDTRFYEHGGIDWVRALGAVRANLAGSYRQGASTITMQVARNFFLTRDKHIARKANEIALAYKIEAALSKDQILELYMNQIFLGRRSYGFASAARAYFGKPLDKLSIAEMAMLAGVPQDPVRHNPAINPKRAKQRQLAVLRRMRDVGYITSAQYDKAVEEPIKVTEKRQDFGVHAEYVAELARQAVVEQFKDDAYTTGITVTTTILKPEQDAAYQSLRRNVLAYDQRHGYRGPEAFVTLPEDEAEREEAIAQELRKRPVSDGLTPVMVLDASPKKVTVENLDGDRIDIGPAGLKLVAGALTDKARDAIRLRRGAIVRIAQDNPKAGWAIVQVPQVAAALVALDVKTGGYHALVGGFDFNLQKYNHVTQALRQPGSSMKPFIYSAALEKGYTPATRIADTPLDMPGENAGATWSPQNDDGKYDGEVTMRRALALSKNVASIRLLRAIEIGYAHDYIAKFGFEPARQPKNMTLALGTGQVTPLQLAGAYAVFANGGYKVTPYLISSIKGGDGKVLFETKAPKLEESARVIDQRNAFVVHSMLRDVVRYGTGAAATKALGRDDIAGKTGTTSDAVDGWFAGYGGGVVAVAWMGYDDPKSLGGREFGATLSLPIWIDYMRAALAKRPVEQREVPEGVMQDGEDWIYGEYAGTTDFKTIDIDAAPPVPEAGTPAEGEAAPAAPAAPAPVPEQ
ncbi:MAG: penicillin-binding protein 1A [Gammaproteobacteria bacterium]